MFITDKSTSINKFLELIFPVSNIRIIISNIKTFNAFILIADIFLFLVFRLRDDTIIITKSIKQNNIVIKISEFL